MLTPIEFEEVRFVCSNSGVDETRRAMNIGTRENIAELLTLLAEKQDWDQKTCERCHELVTENLDDEQLDSFYFDFLRYPSLFNLRSTAFHPTRVSVIRVQPNPATMEELRSEFLRVAAALPRRE